MRVTRAARPAPASAWRSGSSNRSPRRVVAAVAAALVVLAGCAGERDETAEASAAARSPQPSFATIESPSIEFLPRGEQIPQWEMIGDPMVYPAEALASYIGRQAKQYVDYEAIDLTVADYQSPGGGVRATIEIYRFPDFVKAFGAYSSRRSAVLEPLPIVNEAFIAPHSIHLWRGPFYVRIVGRIDAANREAFVALARALAGRMPEAPGLPAIFVFFPAETRLPNSGGYSAGPVFGQPYLSGAFTARFTGTEEQPVEGMILPAPSKEVAAEVLDRWEFFFATNGRVLDPIPNLGEDNFVAEDRFMGRTVAFRLDRFVVAYRSFGPVPRLAELAIATNQRILNSIRQQLQAAERAARTAARARNQ